MSATLNSLAQTPDWNTAGNNIGVTEWFGADNGSTIPVRFRHEADDPVSRYEWYTTEGTLQERMRLNRSGWLGLNISTPEMMFHVDDGGILSTGTTGTNPNIGPGTRLMWIPDQAAFRAGVAVGNEWDGTNVGNGSVAFGVDNTVSGDYAAATGFQNTVAGESSQAFGADNDVDGECSSAMGGSNIVMQNASTAIGKANTVEASDALILGIRNVITSGATGAISLGRQTKSEATNNMTIGSGVNFSNPLLNDIAQSIVIGMNSDVPTVFIETSAGVGTFGNVGIGNVTSPTEVLDVRGTARFRVMEEAETPDVVIVGMEADEEQGDYVLQYRPFDAFDPAGDCDWEIVENFPGVDDVITGHGEDCFPEGHVGIGVVEPLAKLDVAHDPDQLNPQENGLRVRWWEDPSEDEFEIVNGILTQVRRHAGYPEARGIRSEAYFATRNYAGDFRAVAGSGGSLSTIFNVGVRGWATGSAASSIGQSVGGDFFADAGNDDSSPDQEVFGVRGRASSGSHAYGVHGSAGGASVENWAGFFVGDTHCSAGVWTSSDASLKQNMESLEGALDVIQQIQPRQYEYQVDAFSQMNLPSGQQQGVIAQELEEVLPNLVKQTTLPAQFDTLGNVISESVEYKSVNYIGLVPYLVAGMKEQQAIIDSQNEALAGVMDQLNELQNQINNCCSGNTGSKIIGTGGGEVDQIQKASANGNVLNQNVPNPFRSQTTISYTLEQGGKVVLNVYDKNGKVVANLEEAEQPADNYRYEWDASGLPAGLYHYALYVDGELLVKKAIKLAD